MNLLQFLWHQTLSDKLPPLPRQYSTEYQPHEVNEDTAMLMRQTHTRSPQGVEVLRKKHGAPSAKDLIEKLPRRRKHRNIPERFVAIIRRALGVTAYDPMRSIARRHMRK